MGYQVYEIDGRFCGYGVPSYCEQPGCNEEIDRGMAFCCGGEPDAEHGCGLYFCTKHLHYHDFKDGECAEVCKRCHTYKSPYKKKPEHPRWVKHLLTDESWEEWRKENPDKVTNLHTQTLGGEK